MQDTIVEFWRRCHGTVHPDDKAYFDRYPHKFNLDFPPPAFIGDVENAPIVLLVANGGYDETATPAEFSTPGSVPAYLDRLHYPRPVKLNEMAPYYAARNYAPLIADGQLVLVNAIAYRSGRISEEPQNLSLSKKLPSVSLHKNWLRKELIPAAIRSERFVIAHRNGHWGLRRNECFEHNVVFTANARPPDPDFNTLNLATNWASTRQTGNEKNT